MLTSTYLLPFTMTVFAAPGGSVRTSRPGTVPFGQSKS